MAAAQIALQWQLHGPGPIAAINAFFAGASPSVMSIKGTLGHPAGAAGALALVAAIEGMHRGLVVHTAGTTNPEPAIDFTLVLSRPQVRAISPIQANAFGFGGQNASLVLSAEHQQ
jgi:3-oxoacyl-[acyl-carrier-protein] synthase II